VIEDAAEKDPTWLLRGFAFMNLEAAVKVTQAKRSGARSKRG